MFVIIEPIKDENMIIFNVAPTGNQLSKISSPRPPSPAQAQVVLRRGDPQELDLVFLQLTARGMIKHA